MQTLVESCRDSDGLELRLWHRGGTRAAKHEDLIAQFVIKIRSNAQSEAKPLDGKIDHLGICHFGFIILLGTQMTLPRCMSPGAVVVSSFIHGFVSLTRTTVPLVILQR